MPSPRTTLAGSTAAPEPRARVNRGGRPSKQEHHEISARILECASALFAQQGYAATSIEQIAASCSMGKDTIYRRYASKAVLFEEVIASLSRRAFAQLSIAVPDEGPALPHLKKLLRWLLTINLTPDFIAFKRIVMSETLILDGVRVKMPASDPTQERIVSLIRQAQQDGAMADGDPSFISDRLVNGIISGPVIQAMLGHPPMPAPQQDAYFEQAWNLLMQGAASRA